jgi:hypothetical protein
VKGERGKTAGRQRGRERGQVVVLFAVALPMLLAMGSVVLAVGNWYVHAKNLQTKVDAAAFAGGGAWGFPCGPDIDANIEREAREYVGDHTAADGTAVTGGYNPQVGRVGGDQIFVALNQSQWWSGSFAASDFSSPSGAVCDSKTLDVKATEHDTPLIWRLIPLFPDIKRKARVEIQEVAGLTGLLPIAVRLPQPLSAAAVFYDEANRSILGVRYFRYVCNPFVPTCLNGVPAGLGQWTTEPATSDPSPAWAMFNVAATTGVVIATSFRPACGAGSPPATAPCLEDSGWTGRPVNDFCRQAGSTVQCYDATGSGSTQSVASGVQFIRGFGSTAATTGAPEFRSAYLEPPSSSCYAYFTSSLTSCTARLSAVVDVGTLIGNYPPPVGNTAPLRAGDIQVRYRLVRANGTPFCDYGVNCDLRASGSGPTLTFSTQGTASSNDLPLPVDSRGNAVAIQVRLQNAVNSSIPACRDNGFDANCQWFYTGSGAPSTNVPTDAQILAAPVQRSFMGSLDRTGPLRWLRLTVDQDCNLLTFADRVVGHDLLTGADAASQPAGAQRCYVVDMGLSGGLAQDQDEPPIAFNLGDNSSQRAYIDCDPVIANLKSEIVSGCQQPPYAANSFDTSPICPGVSAWFDTPKASPFGNWPPFRCVLTQTGNSSQVIQGFNERIFDTPNNPRCPGDANEYVKGRNYWHRMNNMYDDETFAWDGTGPPGPGGAAKGNTLSDADPRLVTLFFTTYDSFTSTGNEIFPIVGFGNFYVTGYGETQNGGWKGGKPEDPCTAGNDGDLMNGTGNEPPPDLDMSRNTRWVWGHFVNDVKPSPFTTGGSGALCNPGASFQPCVAVLVE